MAEQLPLFDAAVEQSVGELRRERIAALSQAALSMERMQLKIRQEHGAVCPYTGTYVELRFAEAPNVIYKPPKDSAGKLLNRLPPDEYLVGKVLFFGQEDAVVELQPYARHDLYYLVPIVELDDVTEEALSPRDKRHYPTRQEAETWQVFRLPERSR